MKPPGRPRRVRQATLSDELSAHLKHLQLVFDHLEDVVYVARVDPDGYRFVAVNAAFFEATGLQPAEVEGRLIGDVIPSPSLELVNSQVEKAIRTGQPVHWKDVTAFPAGTRHGEVMVAPVFDPDGRCTHLVGTVHDVTAHHQARDALQHLANTDELTTLPNRACFRRHLANDIERARSGRRIVALFYLDVDDFKVVNDSLGHDVGDALLWLVARRLCDQGRPSDFVARLGGDEFGVVAVLDDYPAAASACAQRLSELFREPFTVQGHELRISASIGIASFPGDAQTEGELVRLADTAMYRAKATGRNRHLFYSEEMNLWAQERRDMEQALKVAIEQGQFQLHYQAKVDLHSRRILGLEALLRWNRPDTGFVSPAAFVPRLEEMGLIEVVTDWVISEACRQLGEWRRIGVAVVPVAVNLSQRQFVADNHDGLGTDAQTRLLAAKISHRLEEHQLPTSLLELEVTETSLMIDWEFAIQCLLAVRAIGVRIHIDDFGTGYSSLAHLKRLPLDSLKIDRTFVSDLPDAAEDVAVVRAVIALAHSLGFEVIAEGVETAAQHDFLTAAGCDVAQGFLYARPLPPRDLATLLRAGSMS